jgi:hypothetical protein
MTSLAEQDDRQLGARGSGCSASRGRPCGARPPTRPHPVVSRRPPGNALAAVPLTLLDRGRDALDSGARRFPRLQRPASRTSDRLAAVAGRVEHAGPLRPG